MEQFTFNVSQAGHPPLMATIRGTGDEFNTGVERVVAHEPFLSLSILDDISIFRGEKKKLDQPE